MAHVPYRDNPELADISEDDKIRISMLADDLELASQQLQHEDRCACIPGRKQHWKCIHGAVFPSVDIDEVLAMAFARGLLVFPE